MELLEKITAFADEAHGTQTRKYSSDRYIVHPVRVMKTCSRFTNDPALLAAALLHDVLEDTNVSAAAIKQFLLPLMGETDTQRTLSLVRELTDVYVTENYPQWNRRKRKQQESARIKKTSADAQTIKYADIIDNCEIAVEDPSFATTYLRECKDLLKVIPEGNAQLYEEAVKTVNDSLALARELKSANKKTS